MSDFECLMQILGTETHEDIKEHLLYLLKEEIQEAFFRKKDGSVFTANEAITMLENTDVFNDNQNLLINVCLYAIKHCYPHIAKEERGGTNEQIY